MGNFRHQSIRTAERDKDKDTDKERERDIRDKEGAEKLRSVRFLTFAELSAPVTFFGCAAV